MGVGGVGGREGGRRGAGGWRSALLGVWKWFSHSPVAPTHFPTSLSWLTGSSSLEKGGLKAALHSMASDPPLPRLQQCGEL